MNIMEKFQAYVRILRVASKPSLYEFKSILKITGIGLMIIGGLGFVIRVVAELI